MPCVGSKMTSFCLIDSVVDTVPSVRTRVSNIADYQSHNCSLFHCLLLFVGYDRGAGNLLPAKRTDKVHSWCAVFEPVELLNLHIKEIGVYSFKLSQMSIKTSNNLPSVRFELMNC